MYSKGWFLAVFIRRGHFTCLRQLFTTISNLSECRLAENHFEERALFQRLHIYIVCVDSKKEDATVNKHPFSDLYYFRLGKRSMQSYETFLLESKVASLSSLSCQVCGGGRKKKSTPLFFMKWEGEELHKEVLRLICLIAEELREAVLLQQMQVRRRSPTVWVFRRPSTTDVYIYLLNSSFHKRSRQKNLTHL